MQTLASVVSAWAQPVPYCEMYKANRSFNARVGMAGRWVDITDQVANLMLEWSGRKPQPDFHISWQTGNNDYFSLPQESQTIYSPFELEISLVLTTTEREQLRYVGVPTDQPITDTYLLRVPVYKNAHLARLATQYFR